MADINLTQDEADKLIAMENCSAEKAAYQNRARVAIVVRLDLDGLPQQYITGLPRIQKGLFS